MGKDPKEYLEQDVFFETKSGEFIWLYEEEERKRDILKEDEDQEALDSDELERLEDEYREGLDEDFRKSMEAHENARRDARRMRYGGYGCW